MDWTEILVEVGADRIDEAAAIANMTVPYGIYIEDYSDLEQEVMEIAHVDLIDEDLLKQDRSKAKESNRRVSHNEYYFFADIPVDAAQSVIDSFVDALERIVGEDLWDISIIYDYTAAAPDGTAP